MDIYEPKFTQLQQLIFRLLCVKNGSYLNKRNIAKLLNFSPTAVAKALPLLEKENYIISEKNSIGILITLNNQDQKTIELKRVENLKIIYETRLNEHLEEKFPGSTIILFGSYSRGEDTTSSDIDIAIIGSKPKEINLKAYEKELERTINLQFYPRFNTIHKNLQENICNGIILAGGINL